MNNIQAGFDLDAFMEKSKGGSKVKYADIGKDGTYYLHVLPPISKTNRQLSHTYNTHWVNNGGERKIQVACTYYTDRNCPLCNAHNEVNTKLEAMKKLSKEGAQVDASLMKSLEDAEFALRKSKNVYYTAANVNNELVVLKVSSTVSGLLDKVIAKLLTEEGFDPTNPRTGAWIRFDRTGKGREAVTVSVKEALVEFQGRRLKETDRSPLPEETIEKFEAGEGPDIHDGDQMYVRQYSVAELDAFLQGVQLPNRRPVSPTREASAIVSNPVVGRDVEAVQQAPAPAAPVVAAAPVAPAPTATTTTAPAAPLTNNLAAEIERLRALTAKK